MITRWRLKNTREGQQLSCRYWRHRWDISSLELELTKHQQDCLDTLWQMPDAGTYTLRGENRNGSDKVRKHHQQITNILIIFLTIGMKVDLDLVVLETGHDAECELLKSGNLECRCSQSFRWIFTVVNFAALDWKWQSCVQDIGTISGNADRRRLWRRIFCQRNLRSSRLHHPGLLWFLFWII